VRIPTPANGSNDDFVSQSVDVVSSLDGQRLNGQDLTYIRSTTVLKAAVTDFAQLAQLSVAERNQSVTYLNGWGQPLQQVAVQAGPSEQDLIQHLSYAGTPTTTKAFLPFPVDGQTKAAGLPIIAVKVETPSARLR
jgi:hypothetical protein